MTKKILLLCLLILSVGCYSNTQKIKPEDLSINPDIINHAKYEISIDCEWIKNHQNNNLIEFDQTVINATNLCKKVFPDLFDK